MCIVLVHVDGGAYGEIGQTPLNWSNEGCQTAHGEEIIGIQKDRDVARNGRQSDISCASWPSAPANMYFQRQ
jgi:hypothetical protein